LQQVRNEIKLNLVRFSFNKTFTNFKLNLFKLGLFSPLYSSSIQFGLIYSLFVEPFLEKNNPLTAIASYTTSNFSSIPSKSFPEKFSVIEGEDCFTEKKNNFQK